MKSVLTLLPFLSANSAVIVMFCFFGLNRQSFRDYVIKRVSIIWTPTVELDFVPFNVLFYGKIIEFQLTPNDRTHQESRLLHLWLI